MFNIARFISENITSRSSSMFALDIESNHAKLQKCIEGKKVLVIGGAGTIGSSYIRAILPFRPSQLVVVDISENGLTELTRDLRSTAGMYIPVDYRTYSLIFADPIFEKIFEKITDLKLLLIFQHINMFEVKRIVGVYKRCWKTTY